MEPGKELNRLVAEIVIGADPFVWRHYSTDWTAAGEAWEWLEENKPRWWGRVALGKSLNESPAVLLLDRQAGEWSVSEEIEGESYPHAIALAVVRVARAKEN